MKKQMADISYNLKTEWCIQIVRLLVTVTGLVGGIQ